MPNPQLIVFAGLPANGKSHLARSLAREIRAVYLDKDTIKDCAIRIADEMRLEQGAKIAGALSYELLVDLARDNLSLGHTVVLDSPAAYITFRDKIKALTRTAKAELKLIECICTDERLLRDRIEQRGRELPPHRTRDWQTYQADQARFERITDPRLVVDTAETDLVNLRKIRAYLGEGRQMRLIS